MFEYFAAVGYTIREYEIKYSIVRYVFSNTPCLPQGLVVETLITPSCPSRRFPGFACRVQEIANGTAMPELSRPIWSLALSLLMANVLSIFAFVFPKTSMPEVSGLYQSWNAGCSGTPVRRAIEAGFSSSED